MCLGWSGLGFKAFSIVRCLSGCGLPSFSFVFVIRKEEVLLLLLLPNREEDGREDQAKQRGRRRVSGGRNGSTVEEGTNSWG